MSHDQDLKVAKTKVETLVKQTLDAEKAAGKVALQKPEESPEHFQKEIDKLAKTAIGKEAIESVLKDHEKDKGGWEGKGVLRDHLPHKEPAKGHGKHSGAEAAHVGKNAVAASPEIEAVKQALSGIKLHDDKHSGPPTTGSAPKNIAAKLTV